MMLKSVLTIELEIEYLEALWRMINLMEVNLSDSGSVGWAAQRKNINALYV
jgi:hypothetical protein